MMTARIESGCAMQMRAMGKAIAVLAASLAAAAASADEGGVSFWLPGQMGSLAAVPTEPGLSMPLVYYHSSGDEGADKQFTRGSRVTAGIDATADIVLAVPTYTFSSALFGAQPSVGLGFGGGHVKVKVNETLTGPNGATVSGAESDSLDGVADLYPTASLKWHEAAHNYMLYTMWGVPVGSYSPHQLANLGTNHWSIDGGGGYTYFNPKTGWEFSAVLGFTYNLENDDTHYQNGIDSHLDWAASRFLSQQLHVGLAGYVYYQLTGDSGSGAVLGDFKSRVAGIGPQVGYFIKSGGRTYYVNAKANWEFGAQNRPEGWNLWLTFVIPLG